MYFEGRFSFIWLWLVCIHVCLCCTCASHWYIYLHFVWNNICSMFPKQLWLYGFWWPVVRGWGGVCAGLHIFSVYIHLRHNHRFRMFCRFLAAESSVASILTKKQERTKLFSLGLQGASLCLQQTPRSVQVPSLPVTCRRCLSTLPGRLPASKTCSNGVQMVCWNVSLESDSHWFYCA